MEPQDSIGHLLKQQQQLVNKYILFINIYYYYKEEMNKCKSILDQLKDVPKQQIITEKKSESSQTDLIRVS